MKASILHAQCLFDEFRLKEVTLQQSFAFILPKKCHCFDVSRLASRTIVKAKFREIIVFMSYMQFRKPGFEATPDAAKARADKGLCLICDTKSRPKHPHRRGLCPKHYAKFRKELDKVPDEAKQDYVNSLILSGMILGSRQGKKIADDTHFEEFTKKFLEQWKPSEPTQWDLMNDPPEDDVRIEMPIDHKTKKILKKVTDIEKDKAEKLKKFHEDNKDK